jgi:membrane-anchored protein YejM (alkaline phosphatase superfamily)
MRWSILSATGRTRWGERGARRELSAEQSESEANPTRRLRVVHFIYGFLLVAITVLGTGFAALVRLRSGYAYPPLFDAFRALFFFEHGVFLAAVLAMLLYFLPKFRLPRVVQAIAYFAFYTWFLWILVWGLVHHAHKIELTFASVIDLLTHWQTIEEVGFTPREFSIILSVAVLIAAALTAATLPLVRRLGENGRRIWFISWLLAFLLVHIPVRAYAVYQINRNQPAVLAYDDCVALPLRSESLVPGLRSKRFAIANLESRERTASYFDTLKNLRMPKLPRRPNILWLNIESLRYDGIDPAFMPHLWAQRDQFQIQLDQDHWAGGNATQFGVVSMLTGMSGHHFASFQKFGVKAPFLTLLAKNNYRLRGGKVMYFSYGGLFKLLPRTMELPRLPRRSLYKEDVVTIDEYLKDRHNQTDTKPRFDFLPFDATHYPYGFPPQDDLFRPSTLLRSSQHALRSGEDLELARNRYRNGCHFIDSQIGRVFDDLQSRGGFANTIIIVLGDHGEEFQERGQLTHSAVLNDFQGRTVLWMHFPDLPPGRIPVESPTVNLDIIPTLLSAVGFKVDVLYTQGFSLFEKRAKRNILALCEQGFRVPLYRDLVTEKFISRWSYRPHQWLFSGVQRRDGAPVTDQSWLTEAQTRLDEAARMYEILPDTSQPPRRFNLR